MTPTVPRRPRPAGPLWRLGLPVLGVGVAILLWQGITWLFQVRTRDLPSPWQVAVSFRDNARYLLDEALVTALETLAGFAAGAVGGLLVAALLALSAGVERATLPLVVALNAVPKVALAPLLTLWLGLRYAPHVALAAVLCFFPVLFAARAGLRATPADLTELAGSLTASRWQTFVKIRVPWALPRLVGGLRAAMTLAVIGTVVAQFVRPSGGLGTVILLSGQSDDTARVIAAIALLTVISVTLFYGMVAAERLLLPWADATTDARR